MLFSSFAVSSMVVGGEANDFENIILSSDSQSQTISEQKPGKGVKRKYLLAYETVPAQMLNVYGRATFPDMADEDVWGHMNQPLKTGGLYMTEYCSAEEEQRGIGFNRFCLSMLSWLKHNMSEKVAAQNKMILDPQIFKQLDEEMKSIQPHFDYCLAPKKEYTPKTGASSLRSGSIHSVSQATSTKDNASLDKHSEAIYQWLDLEKRSRVRMLMNWQAAGGLSFVAATHHRATQCFRYFGNKMHHDTIKEVSLSEFQTCVRARHAIGSNGMERDDATSADFK